MGLAKVGNPAKQKWLYAFNVVPAKHMERKELVAQPPDATESPFSNEDLACVEEMSAKGSNQFFYDMNAPMEDKRGGKRRGGGRGGGQHQNQYEKRPRREPTGPCWFCLSGSDVEKHLVVSVGDHAYLALPKGGLTTGHVLILPIAHHACMLEVRQC